MAVDKNLKIVLTAEDRASKQLGRISGTLGKLGKVAGIASTAVAGLGLAMGTAAIKQAVQFEQAMSDINTLFDDNGESIAQLEKGVKDLLKVVPKDAEDLGASAYAIVSAGINDTNDALAVLESSSKLAVAGLGETSEATDIVTSAINAFGIDAKKSQKVANTFFLAVKSGKTTVSELARGFGQVAPLANELGVSFEELMANTAAMTTSGLKASIAYTSQKAVLSNLLKPTKEMKELMDKVGMSSAKASIESDGFTETLRSLYDATEGNNEQLAKAFGSVEGLNAVMMLMNKTGDEAWEIMGKMHQGAGDLEIAFQKQTETTKAQWQMLKNNLNVALIELGSVILPAVNRALEPMIGLIQKSTETFNWFIETGGKPVMDWFKNMIELIDLKTGLISTMKEAWNTIHEAFVNYLLPTFKNLLEMFKRHETEIRFLIKLIGKVFVGSIILLVEAIARLVAWGFKLLSWLISFANLLDKLITGSVKTFINFLGEIVDSLRLIIDLSKKVGESFQGAFAGGIGGIMKDLSPFGKGGIVTGPTPALVGEAGPEAIIPLDRLDEFGLGGGININITGTFMSEEAAEEMGDKIIEKLKSNLRL